MKPLCLIRAVALLGLLALAACFDEGPVSGPGQMAAKLVSPNGAEGAALISLYGEGIGDVTAFGDTEVFTHQDSAGTRIVLINQVGGELNFRVSVADTLQPLEWGVDQVAGPDDSLRSSVVGYQLELSP